MASLAFTSDSELRRRPFAATMPMDFLSDGGVDSLN
jgi:hypothetical protein